MHKAGGSRDAEKWVGTGRVLEVGAMSLAIGGGGRRAEDEGRTQAGRSGPRLVDSASDH